jgi:hypothetical protein
MILLEEPHADRPHARRVWVCEDDRRWRPGTRLTEIFSVPLAVVPREAPIWDEAPDVWEKLHPPRGTGSDVNLLVRGGRAAARGIQDELSVKWLHAAVTDLHGYHIETPLLDLAIESPQGRSDLKRRRGFPREQEPQGEDCEESGTVHVVRTVAEMPENV